MKKKIFVGLLASVLVCLTFVFTNASSDSVHVSGTVWIGDQPQADVSITLNNSSAIISTTDERGSFGCTVPRNSELTFSYTDEGDTNGSWRSSLKCSSSMENVDVHLDYKSSSSDQR